MSSTSREEEIIKRFKELLAKEVTGSEELRRKFIDTGILEFTRFYLKASKVAMDKFSELKDASPEDIEISKMMTFVTILTQMGLLILPEDEEKTNTKFECDDSIPNERKGSLQKIVEEICDRIRKELPEDSRFLLILNKSTGEDTLGTLLMGNMEKSMVMHTLLEILKREATCS